MAAASVHTAEGGPAPAPSATKGPSSTQGSSSSATPHTPRKPSLTRKLLALPSFALAIFVFYWSLPLCALCGLLHVWDFRRPRADMYNWTWFMCKVFGVRVKRFGPNTLHKGPRVMYLCNHRSWTDFFLDAYLTEGNAAAMSRWLVFTVFPVFLTSVIVVKGVVLFKRGTIRDKQAFNSWIDSKMDSSPTPRLLLYPEGHRSTRPTSLPLKRGMLHYAHSRKLPVQLVISRDKERVLSEKDMEVRYGVTVVTGFSEVIPSADIDFQTFMGNIQSTWDRLWADVYGADAAGLPELEHDSVPAFNYSLTMRVQQLATVVTSLLLFFLLLAGLAKAVVLVSALAGDTEQKVLVSCLIAWVFNSLLSSRA